MATASKQTKLYNLEVTVTEAPVVKPNSNQKEFLVARGTTKAGRKVTVQTYVKSGIAALKNATVGQTLRIYGTFNKNVFSAMGLTPAREATATPASEAPALAGATA